MEETLRQLQEVMQAHRRAIAGLDPLSRDIDEGAAIVPRDERSAVVQKLARDVERVCGIEITGMMEAKLGRVLTTVALPELRSWVDRLHRLPADAPEWLSLVESLTVHETFFFRDPAQFELLRRNLLPELIAAAAREGTFRLRLWSAGCATGEEAYTLAIVALLALRDAGFAHDQPDGGIACAAPWRIEVLGSDISRVVLARAATATYTAEELGAFRHLPAELERFVPTLPRRKGAGGADARSVHASVRRHVAFAPFNLMADAPPIAACDAVLCRNVLIYLTLPARAKALAALRRALRPGGYLMLGPTDALTDATGCETCWGEGAVAYRLKPVDMKTRDG
jgi:chemotaxis protein methyltransferase CheR